MNNTTGISTTEYTLPLGQELPALNWETEGHELSLMLREIDRAMSDVDRDSLGDNYQAWYRAWTDEFMRIRKQMGMFDPYSQTF